MKIIKLSKRKCQWADRIKLHLKNRSKALFGDSVEEIHWHLDYDTAEWIHFHIWVYTSNNTFKAKCVYDKVFDDLYFDEITHIAHQYTDRDFW